MKSKSIREIAEEIAEGVTNSEHHNAKLARRIEQALRDERERAAKIAEAMRPTGGRVWTDEQTACFEALTDCAAAIRKQDD